MAFEDSVKAWKAAVDNGLISGDPKYYSGDVDDMGNTILEPAAQPDEYYHALLVAILEAHGIDWQSGDQPEPPPSSGNTPFDSPRQTNRLHLVGEENVTISGLFFDGTDGLFQSNRSNNNHVCIFLENCRNIRIEGVGFRNVSQPVAVFGGSDIEVVDSWCDGITGPSTRDGNQQGNFIQTYQAPQRIGVHRNYIRGGDTEDIISFFSSVDAVASYNVIDGSGWKSGSGTGIILGDGGGSGQVAHHNKLYRPGQVGIAIAGGTGGIAEDNIIYNPAGYFGSNVGMYSNNYYPEHPWGGNIARRNRVNYLRFDGSSNQYWNNGGCDWYDNQFGDESVADEDFSMPWDTP